MHYSISAQNNYTLFSLLSRDDKYIYNKRLMELPGCFRPTKEWDLLVVKDGHLIAAIEAKSQVGPSFGNNFNNRTEEAMGSSALDLWTAFREGAFNGGAQPFLGYFFMLEDYRLVRMFSFYGDTVLDPFCGSGTSMIAALRTGRNSIGIDIDSEYCRMSARNLKAESNNDYVKAELIFEKMIFDSSGTMKVSEDQARYKVRPVKKIMKHGSSHFTSSG